MRHRLITLALVSSCCLFRPVSSHGACPATTGDIAPGTLEPGTPPTFRIQGNEDVDIGDAVASLRASIGLQSLAWTAPGPGCPAVPGDVAPGMLDTSTVPPTWRPSGDGRVGIDDVVVTLRTAVELQVIASAGPATILGTITSVSGAPIGAARISLDGIQVEANEGGWFVVPDAPIGSRILVTVSKSGYVTSQQVLSVVAGASTFADIQLIPAAPPVAVSATAGGTVDSQGARLVLPPASVETATGQPFTGTIMASVTNLDPASAERRMAAPGDYSTLIAGGGEEGQLETFGMVDVTLVDAGNNPLQLDGLATARLEIPPPADGLASPSTVGLYHYDMAQGRWVEAGTVARDAGTGRYVADVSHFSTWNADAIYSQACVTGRVVDAAGNPVVNANVRSEGVTYRGTASSSTRADGSFRLAVKASLTESESADIIARSGDVEASPRRVSPTPAQGECTDIGTITLAPPIARIILTWGEDPYDLDSHFSGPAGAGRFHVYFASRQHPQAELDTDDTSSYGPEVVTLLQANPGTYVYAVHNYSGEDSWPIASSGASVIVQMPSEVRTFTSSSAAMSATTDDTAWRVFRFTIDGSGRIGSVEPLNEIVDSDDNALDP